MANSSQVLALYRAFLREGSRFPNYNIREYIKRRAREGFHESKSITNKSEVSKLVSQAASDLALVRRQSLVYGMYSRPQKSILDVVVK